MSIFESEVIINRPVAEVYSFLADFNNHERLMADSVQDWKSTIDSVSFNIQNMIMLHLKIENRVENRELLIAPSEKPPFKLELKWELEVINEGVTKAKYTITAELSMMLKMLASGPLQKLAEQETQLLASILI